MPTIVGITSRSSIADAASPANSAPAGPMLTPLMLNAPSTAPTASTTPSSTTGSSAKRSITLSNTAAQYDPKSV